MRQQKRSIKKDMLKRKYFTKIEIRKVLLKSIIQNKHLKPLTRSLAIYKYSRMKLVASISKQNNNICLKTGRYKGVVKLTNLSRHYVKKLGITGDLQNFKIASW